MCPWAKLSVDMCPWAKLGVDMCSLHGCTLLVVCNYFSNYLEVEHITGNVTSRSVIKVLSSLFARHDIPDLVVSDNESQFLLPACDVITSLHTVKWEG